MRGRPRRSVVLTLAALAVLASCGGTPEADGPSASTSPTSSLTPSSTSTTEPSQTLTPGPSSTSAQPSSSPPSPSTPAPSTTTPASCSVPDGLAGQDLERLPLTAKVVALTFDGGSGAQGAPSILDTLEEEGVPGTFFLTGQFARTFPETSARIGADHLVGNHTDTHPDLTTLTDAQIRAEVGAAQSSIRTATGQDPRRFFRFPFGARNDRTVRVVNELCYVPFRWTVDTLGWKGTSGGQTVDSVVQRVVAAAQPGEIVLMHLGANPDDGSTLDADALPRIIDRLRDLGYSFVPLSRVMSAAP